ncbi:MAG: ATP-binding protein [Candidatus Limnocylindrales bacterium]
MPTDLPNVWADAAQLQQVLLNLTLNAIQAIRSNRPSGTITVSARTENRTDDRARFVRVRVEDDGPGIAAEVRPRVFEPFFTTKYVGQGTGLGLSVSYGIVTAHGGRLWFEPSDSGGAAFLLELPVAEPSAGRDDEASPTPRDREAPSTGGLIARRRR